jgi:hypothetical protein
MVKQVTRKVREFRDAKVLKAAKAFETGDANVIARLGDEKMAGVADALKRANGDFAQLQKDMAELGKLLSPGRKINNVADFLDVLGKIPDERVIDRIFSKNPAVVQRMEKFFPDQIELLRKAKISALIDESVDPTTGRISVKKFTDKLAKLDDASLTNIFQNNKQVVDDIASIRRSMPNIIEGMEKPLTQSEKAFGFLPLGDMARYIGVKGGTPLARGSNFLQRALFLNRAVPTTRKVVGSGVGQAPRTMLRFYNDDVEVFDDLPAENFVEVPPEKQPDAINAILSDPNMNSVEKSKEIDRINRHGIVTMPAGITKALDDQSAENLDTERRTEQGDSQNLLKEVIDLDKVLRGGYLGE